MNIRITIPDHNIFIHAFNKSTVQKKQHRIAREYFSFCEKGETIGILLRTVKFYFFTHILPRKKKTIERVLAKLLEVGSWKSLLQYCGKNREFKENLNIIEALPEILGRKIPKNDEDVKDLTSKWNNYQILSLRRLKKFMEFSHFKPDYSIRDMIPPGIDQIDREIIMESKAVTDDPEFGDSVILTWDKPLINCVKSLNIKKLFADTPDNFLNRT